MAVDVLAPPLGTNVDTVTVVEWYAGEGDQIEKDQPLFAVETDKATLDVEAPASGVLRAIRCAAGDTVTALAVIAVITTAGEPWPPPSSPGAHVPAPTESGGSTVADPTRRQAAGPPDPRPHRVFISPRARRLAESHSLQWKGLTGTGPDGAIVTRDVRAAIGSAGPAQRKVRERTPLTGVRALTAKRMQESAATTVPVTLTTEVDATGLSARRRELRELGQTVSYNDLLIQLVARTLREHPRLNASLVDDHIHYWDEVHVGLAVDSDRGLLVPVVRNADEKPLSAIAAETGARVADARAGRLAADQVGNATFTITNLGMFGIDAFTPVIPLPECAILGVGRIRPQPAVVNGELRVRERTWLSLTFDHRLVDGGPAARFLQALCRRIETLVPDE